MLYFMIHISHIGNLTIFQTALTHNWMFNPQVFHHSPHFSFLFRVSILIFLSNIIQLASFLLPVTSPPLSSSFCESSSHRIKHVHYSSDFQSDALMCEIVNCSTFFFTLTFCVYNLTPIILLYTKADVGLCQNSLWLICGELTEQQSVSALANVSASRRQCFRVINDSCKSVLALFWSSPTPEGNMGLIRC